MQPYARRAAAARAAGARAAASRSAAGSGPGTPAAAAGRRSFRCSPPLLKGGWTKGAGPGTTPGSKIPYPLDDEWAPPGGRYMNPNNYDRYKAHGMHNRMHGLRNTHGLEDLKVQEMKDADGHQDKMHHMRRLLAHDTLPVPTLHTITYRIAGTEMRVSHTLAWWQQVFDWEILHYTENHINGFSQFYVGPRVVLHIKPERKQWDHKNTYTGTSAKDKAWEMSEFLEESDNAQLGNVAGDPDVPLTWKSMPGSMDAHDYAFHYHYTMMEFIWLMDVKDDYRWRPSSGNDPPYLGFGGVTVQVPDLSMAMLRLRKLKTHIISEPTDDEPTALVCDPDGYAVRLMEREPSRTYSGRRKGTTPAACLGAARLRVKNAQHSVYFYERFFGCRLVCRRRHERLGITRYYLVVFEQLMGDLGMFAPLMPNDIDSQDAWDRVCSLRHCFIELQHHDGTEDIEDFEYHSGNTPPVGYAHMGFMVEDLTQAVTEMAAAGVFIAKSIGEGAFPQSAMVLDPDGYFVEMYPRQLRDEICLSHSAQAGPLTLNDRYTGPRGGAGGIG